MSHQLVFQLSGTCNSYPWGRVGKESLAAQLCEKTPGTGFEIKDDQPYSEMWFGDYPDFPARKLDTGELLKDVLERHKEELLGKKVIEEFGGQLPYLPKVSRARVFHGTRTGVSANELYYTPTRSCQSPRHCRSRSTPTRTWRASCTRRTRATSRIRTTSPRSRWPSESSRSSRASSRSRRSNPYSSSSHCVSSFLVVNNNRRKRSSSSSSGPTRPCGT